MGIRLYHVEPSQAADPSCPGIAGVIHADALFGTPDIVAIVVGDDIRLMDEVIDQIADLDDVVAMETKVARWLDDVGPPSPYAGHSRKTR